MVTGNPTRTRVNYAAERFETSLSRARARVPGLPDGVTVEEELENCRKSFLHFLRWWRFEDRETGVIRNFADPWPGQVEVAEAMMTHRRVYALKAGKLGFTELECAYDGWVLRFKQSNARVHVFSLDGEEAKILARIVRFGMDHLPDWMALPVATDIAGGDTTRQIRWVAGRDDYRTLRAYPSTKSASIANSCVHAHIDELARMPWPEETYSAAISTVPAHGSLHIVTRGAGSGSYSEELWEQAKQPESPMHALFVPYWGRPRMPIREMPPGSTQEDLNRAWYEEQRTEFTSTQQLYMFAPRTAEEALAPDAEEAFIPIELWDSCYSPDLPEYNAGDPMPCVLSLDAGVTNDYFAVTVTTRNPANMEQAALRRWRVWKPEESGGVVDFDAVERWIRMVALGGCVRGHPNPRRGVWSNEEGCDACANGTRIQPYSVKHICFDPYQLETMMQRMSRESVAWIKKFDQGRERLEADTSLRQLIMRGDFVHCDNPEDRSDMRQHIMNAKIKVPTGEDTRARMEKRTPRGKIDLAVSLSMGVKRVLWLRIG